MDGRETAERVRLAALLASLRRLRGYGDAAPDEAARAPDETGRLAAAFPLDDSRKTGAGAALLRARSCSWIIAASASSVFARSAELSVSWSRDRRQSRRKPSRRTSLSPSSMISARRQSAATTTSMA